MGHCCDSVDARRNQCKCHRFSAHLEVVEKKNEQKQTVFID